MPEDEPYSFSKYIRETLDRIEIKVNTGFKDVAQSHSALEQRLNVSDGRITALETRVSIHEGQVGHSVGVTQLRDCEKRIDTLESQVQTVDGVLQAQQDQRQTRRWLIGTFAAVCMVLLTLLGAIANHVTLHP